MSRSESRTPNHTDSEQEQEAAPDAPLATFWEQFGSLLVAVAIALGIRAFVIEPFRIPSESMLPTLLIGDHLFVNKFAYGARIPFTEIRAPGLGEPQRGDVVVFTVARDPRMPSRICPVDRCPGMPTEEFVKRIVGLPGDTVEVRSDGSVRVNGERIVRDDLGTTFGDEHGRDLDLREENNGRCTYQVLDNPDQPGAREHFRVEPGRYFMMGDNRDHSNDSRSWGTVRAMEFKGPALFLYWSWSYNGGWLELLDPRTWWNAEKRWGRLGDSLGCEPVTASEAT